MDWTWDCGLWTGLWTVDYGLDWTVHWTMDCFDSDGPTTTQWDGCNYGPLISSLVSSNIKRVIR